MVAAGLGKGGWERFRIGYVAGLAHYLSMLYWLLLIPYRWHGLPLGPALGWLALGAFLALFSGAWVWFATSMGEANRQTQNVKSDAPAMAASFLEMVRGADQTVWSGVLHRKWVHRLSWALGGAASWVALEMVLARIFGGFPWDLLGVSQYHLVPLLQIASITGVYGVSFLVVWVSLSLLSAGLMLIRRPTGRSVWVGETALPVLAVAILFNTGLRELRSAPANERTLKAALVQPSIPQTLIWNSDNDDLRFQELLRLTEQALATPADLVVWPEAAVPRMVRYDTNTMAGIADIARRHHVWMIIGSDDAEPKRHPRNADDAYFFNSSFLVDPSGAIRERYLKRNLVIFGEYLPLQDWLPFLKYFTPIQGGFTAGTRAQPFILDTLGLQTSVLICFEDIFPHLTRTDVTSATDFLVNITNDGWFGNGAAQRQQGMSALFRAIENRVPLIRCSNNGLTCWVDEYGRVRQAFQDSGGGIYGTGFLRAEVELPEGGARRNLTFYTRHGDWFGWGCFGLTGLAVGSRLALRRKKTIPLL